MLAATREAFVIPLIDLHAQYRQIGRQVEEAVVRVLRSGQYALGPEVDALEVEFARYCGVGDAVGTNSGTSALYLALRASGVGPGDEVVTVPFTFVATVATILQTGAVVRFVDVDPQTLTLAPAGLESAITARTKAVVPVHLYGQSADMDPIVEVARTHGLSVIEDASQAHGARYKGRHVGSLGDLACFSFYPTKNLGTCGEGGMVLTNDPDRAALLRQLRNWGQVERDGRILAGSNLRLEGVQAAVLRVKLGYLDAWNEARRAVAGRYDTLLEDIDVTVPVVAPYATHVYNVYGIRTRARDAVVEALHARHIQTTVHYRTPVHLQPAYRHLGYQEGDLPAAEAAARNVLSLPIFPELSAAAQETVVSAVRDAVGTGP